MARAKLTPEVTEGFYYDEANHLYYFDGKPMTGCTTILNVISKPALIQWAANMAVDYIEASMPPAKGEREDVLLSVYARSWVKILQEARKAHAQKRDKAADEGTKLHALVEEYVKKCIAQTGGYALHEAALYEGALSNFAKWQYINNIRFISSEQKLYSKELFVAGTADLIFEKDGKTFIGDIKCKDKIWSREPFFQCAGYALMWEEMYKPINHALGNQVIAGYCVIRLKGDEIETLWSYDTEGDTEAFKAAVTLYRALQNFSSTKTWKN